MRSFLPLGFLFGCFPFDSVVSEFLFCGYLFILIWAGSDVVSFGGRWTLQHDLRQQGCLPKWGFTGQRRLR